MIGVEMRHESKIALWIAKNRRISQAPNRFVPRGRAGARTAVIEEANGYLEVDRGSESTPVLLAKCRTYAAYKATGRAQAEHGVFPRVLWIVPTQRRVQRLEHAIHSDPTLPNRLFTVITPDQVAPTVDPATDIETPEHRT